MDMTRRELLIGGTRLGGGLSLLALAGCAPGAASLVPSPSSQPTAAGSGGPGASPSAASRTATITILTADQSAVKFFNDLAPTFQADHPNYELTFDIPAEQPAEVRQRVLDQLAAGEKIADSTDLDSEDTWDSALAAGLQDKGFRDLTDEAQPFAETVIGALNEGIYKGRIYGVPGLLSAVTYYYRQDLFEKAGITPDIQTWDEFVTAGKTLKEKTGASIMIIEDSTSRHFNYMMPHAGGNVFDNEGKVALDQLANLEALETLVRLKSEGVAFLTSEFYGAGTWEAYRQDQIGGAYMPNWYGDLLIAPNLKEFQGRFKMAPPPKFSAGFTSARGGAPVYPVLDGPNGDIVFEFLSYAFLTPENNVKRFQDFGTPPMVLEAYDDPSVADAVHPFLEQKTAPVYKAMIQKFATVNTHPLLINAYDTLNTQVVPPVLKGEKEPQQALKEAADSLRQLNGE